jgi:phosphatidylinositol phosphate synthase
VTGREAMSTTPDRGAGDYKVALKRAAHQLLDPLVRGMLSIGLQADHLTVLGFALSLGAGVAFAIGKFRIAATIATFAGLCDILDGQLARLGGRVTRFGAFLDSTLDRMEEGIVLTAVARYFSEQGDDLAVAAVVVAVLASLMVSYTRARAEALGVECKVGIADRAVRVVILSAGLVFFSLDLLAPAVYVLAALSTITVFQRIWHVRKELTRPAEPVSDL